MRISIVIPTYNEESTISNCVKSLLNQSETNLEIIIVDDGSRDETLNILKDLKKKHRKIFLYKQTHKGPGSARNLGASYATGDILVFVDGDMVFDKSFIRELTMPIIMNNKIGTDSQSEFLANPDNYWAISWNIGRFYSAGITEGNYKLSMVPNKSNHGSVYRSILKKSFDKVDGFEKSGDYTDDISLSRKLNKKAVLANKAIFYHYNPSSFAEVWARAKWIGSGREFVGTDKNKLINLLKFFPPIAIIKGVIIGWKYKYLQFIFFKLIYDTSIWIQVIKSI